jgi:hypothetical protein
VLVVHRKPRHIELIVAPGLRIPQQIELNPTRNEAYLVGYDETMVLDLDGREVLRALGPGRLTGFSVSPDGRWAAGVTLANDRLLIFGLNDRRSHATTLMGRERGELWRVPVRFDDGTSLVATLDIPAHELVVARLSA